MQICHPTPFLKSDCHVFFQSRCLYSPTQPKLSLQGQPVFSWWERATENPSQRYYVLNDEHSLVYLHFEREFTDLRREMDF